MPQAGLSGHCSYNRGSFDAFVAKIVNNVRSFSINNRGGLLLKTAGSLVAPLVGYARIQPNAGSTTPSGVAIFGLRQNDILVTEAGVPASPLVRAGRIYAEVNGPVSTGIAIANVKDQPANISFYFTDASGRDYGAGSTTIAANNQVAIFLNQSPFNGGSSISGNAALN